METTKKLILVNFRGNVLPMTSEEYQEFVEKLRDGQLD